MRITQVDLKANFDLNLPSPAYPTDAGHQEKLNRYSSTSERVQKPDDYKSEVGVLLGDTATEIERTTSRSKLIKAGIASLSAVEEGLESARGAKRNELIRVRKELVIHEAKVLGGELVELDFEMNSTRMARVASIMKVLEPTAKVMGKDSTTYDNLGVSGAKELVQALIEGVETSKENLGKGVLDSRKSSLGRKEIYSVELKDKRSLSLEFRYTLASDTSGLSPEVFRDSTQSVLLTIRTPADPAKKTPRTDVLHQLLGNKNQ